MGICRNLLATRDIAGVTLTEIIYEGDEVWMHSHEEIHFYMVLEGQCTEHYEGKERDYRPYTTGFLPPGHSHFFERGGRPIRWFCLSAHPHWTEKMGDLVKTVQTSVHSHGGALNEHCLRLYQELHRSDIAARFAIEGIMLEMLAEVSRRMGSSCRKPPSWLANAKEYVDTHFTDELDLAMIANVVDMHPVHLLREFRKYFNCTVGEYIRERRTEFARHQLAITNIPLAHIAIEAGFCDQSHLSRVFKQRTGMTPAEYRRTSSAPTHVN